MMLLKTVRNLGVFPCFSAEHFHKTHEVCFLQMNDHYRIKKHLDHEMAVLETNALVSTHLDYCNSLSRGLSSFNQYKCQCIQNTLARIVTNHRNFAHVTPILKRLHWLPVEYHCIFKATNLVYKFLHSGSLSYFGPYLFWSSCSYNARCCHPDWKYLLFVVLSLMLLRFGMSYLTTHEMPFLLPSSEKSSKFICQQKISSR